MNILQDGHVLANMLCKDPSPVLPAEWGWQQISPDAAPTPVYTTTPVMSKNMPQLVTCKCCVQNQPCMTVCMCQGSCSRGAS